MKSITQISGLILLILSINLFNYCKKEKPAPPVVTTIEATEISYTTAVSGGNIASEGGAAVIERGICWNTNGDPTILNSKKTETGTTGLFICNLTQLYPNTKYYLKAFATNAGGTAYGDQVTFTTVAITAPVLTTTSISSITQTTAVSGGNITDDNGGSISARGVCWSTSGDPTTTGSKTSDGTGTGTFTSSITGLTGNTIYYLKAYATNSAGTTYGEVISFKTSPVIPVISTVIASSISYTTCTSGGNVTDDGGATVIVRGVCWSTSQDPTTSDSKIENGSGTGDFTSSITGLTAGTTYYIRAYATNSIGNQYGNQVTFSTKQITPPTLTTIAITSVTVNTAISGGDITSENGAAVTERGVCLSTTPNPTTSDSKISIDSGIGNFTSILNGLNNNTKYYVRAYAINSAGTGYGNELNFTTFALADLDGNLYHAVTIETQTWLGENLNTTKYNNGESILNITDPTDWYNQISGAYCNYDNNPSNGDIYGRLYNNYAISDPRGVCPSGWHIPSDAEWTTLVDNLGGMSLAGGKIKEIGTTHWASANPGETNDFGFTALPGGFRYLTGTFNGIGDYAYWWSSTEYSSDYHWISYLSRYSGYLLKNFYKKNYGLTVRCLKD